MGVRTGFSSMSTTTDVIYTHKKFKRAAAESWESNEAKKVQQRQSDSQPPISSTPSQPSPTSISPQIQNYSEVLVKNVVPSTVSSHLTFNGHVYPSLDKEIPKDTKPLVCGRCGLSFSRQDVFNWHTCILSEKNIFCSNCKRAYKTNEEFQSHKCVLQSKKPAERTLTSSQLQKDIATPVVIAVEKSDNVQKGIYNRSHSFPGHNDYKHFDESHFEKSSDSLSQLIAGKHIYKPKFRAQYSVQDQSRSLQNSTISDSSVLRFENQESFASRPSSESTTYHSSTASLFNPGLSQFNTVQGKSLGNLDLRNSKNEEFSISKGVASQCSNIWKGIKSPSPELVGQHITNLIVQNQAIVETHNPLWSMKYRRQSSTASTHSESEGGNSQRRKSNENLRTNKFQQGNLYPSSSHETSSDNHGDSSFSSVCSLPRSYFSYPQTQSSSPVRASKNISNPSLSTSSHHKIKNVDSSSSKLSSVHYEYVNAGKFTALSDPASESLDLSKSSKCKTDAFHCNKCNILLYGNEAREQHLKYCYQQLYSHDKCETSLKHLEVKRLEEQEVALDLHKKKDKPIFDEERSFSMGSTSGDPFFKSGPSEDNVSRTTTILSKTFQPFTPLKRKISISDTFIQEKTYTPLFPQNGRMNSSSKCDFGMKMFDEFGKPRGNNHHLYGGEVQICDGKEMKTLKIDPIQSETPSLDLCIASKHFGVDIDARENQVPTSVVVTIAKCGLNSGGTMVKVENQNSGNYTKRTLDVNVVNVQRNSSFTTKSQPEQVINLSSQPVGRIISPLSLHPSLIQYKTPDVSGNPSENVTAISLKLLKGPVPTISVLPKLHSPHSHTLNETIGVQGLVKSSNTSSTVSSLCYKDSGAESSQTVVHSYFPSVISIGEEVIPYVPGIPGPYSQANVILQNPNISETVLVPVSSKDILNNKSFKLKPAYVPPASGNSSSSSSVMNYTSINSSKAHLALTLEQSKPKEYLTSPILSPAKAPAKSHSVINTCMIKPPEIRIHPVSVDTGGSCKSKMDENIKGKPDNGSKVELFDDENTFLIPRKRPNTLVIKPQLLSVKSSLSLIGSTLVSPDTPRPKKSCAQLFLNGSAYTYLNLKVSTKTFFCCIYRPQPMYVLQSTNPKLSMYSNWQVRKTEDPLNISPPEAMSLHVSTFYYNRAYTIAKPKVLPLSLTDSSYWTQKESKSNKVSTANVKSDTTAVTYTKKEEEKTDKVLDMKGVKNKDRSSAIPSAKRIKIFEGGFKTNEAYTYVRGRGRGRYVCETCGIRCKKPSMLKKHIRTHTDLRPFACKHCSFSFKTKGNLTKHLKSKAHFKRCTEMGVVPVPVTANESHVNQEAVHLQGMVGPGKDPMQNMFDDDDEDDDEEEEEEEEDEDEEDEDDEDEDYEEEEEEALSMHKLEIKEEKPPSTSIFSISSYPSSLRENNTSLSRHPSNECSRALCGSSYSEIPTRSFKIDGHIDDTTPMDLSVRRPSVITAFTHTQHPVVSEFVLRPDHLPLPKKFNHDAIKSSTATTPIKEHAKDILSPVTESSLLLKSIYNTTLKVSSSNLKKSNSDSDSMKDTSCGAMLQTYLTERAVLDSTRKRCQYLQSSSEEQFLTRTAGNSSPLAFTSVHRRSPCLVSHSGTLSPRKSIPMDLPTLQSHSTENKTSSESLASLPVPNSNSKVCILSSDMISSTLPVASTSSSIANASYAPVTTVSTSVVQSVVSSCASTVITSLSKTVSEVRATRSGRRSAKSNSAVINAPTMPSSVLNLTVINSSGGGDSKTSFIAPSGVIPSPHNNRLGSDEGKCKCSVCHKEFAKQGQLRLHINIHYIERPHRCESCGISFRTNGHLQKHKRSVSHFNKVNMNMTFGTPSTDNPRPFKCHDCKIAFRIYGHLAKHLRSKLHIMKLECLGKLPFGTYAEIERSGVNLNEIDTSDCENSLESLQLMASKLYEKEPAKLLAWQNQQQQQQQQQKKGSERERTISSSSNNSEEYSLMDEQECGTPSSVSTGKSNEESGDEDDPPEKSVDASSSTPPSLSLPPCEVGSGATEGLIGCPKCHEKFMDIKQYEVHHYSEHENVDEAVSGSSPLTPSVQSSNNDPALLPPNSSDITRL